jgi:UPF0271 protein
MGGSSLEPFGDCAWRLRLPSTGSRRALRDALRAVPCVVDAVVSEHHALVTFEPTARPSPDAVLATLERVLAELQPTAATAEHRVRVRYDGADLDELACSAGLSRAEVVALHAAPTYVVAAVGFQPGFAYLRGLDARLVAPRRATPRPRVPALAVGVAGPYSGVYPFASPGGWNLVGNAVGFVPFDRRAGALLAVGDRVRFVPEGS